LKLPQEFFVVLMPADREQENQDEQDECELIHVIFPL
jgi:hypothetical protein